MDIAIYICLFYQKEAKCYREQGIFAILLFMGRDDIPEHNLITAGVERFSACG